MSEVNKMGLVNDVITLIDKYDLDEKIIESGCLCFKKTPKKTEEKKPAKVEEEKPEK